jgi:amino acid transporter
MLFQVQKRLAHSGFRQPSVSGYLRAGRLAAASELVEHQPPVERAHARRGSSQWHSRVGHRRLRFSLEKYRGHREFIGFHATRARAQFEWIVGAILAPADGLIWAELGAAMPGAGGTYIYLREAFQYRTGRLMPFLFLWSAVLFIPLIMSTGIIGLVQYLGYLIPGVTDDSGNNALGKIIGVGITLLIMVALFGKIGQIGKLTTVLFVIVLAAVLSTIVAAFTHFGGAQAFDFTPGAFGIGGTFWAGLGAGLIIAVYDYLGYNTSAYLGGEVRDPARTIPRSIVVSILGITSLYFLLQIGALGAIPLDDVKTAPRLPRRCSSRPEDREPTPGPREVRDAFAGEVDTEVGS